MNQLLPHDPVWASLFQAESKAITPALGEIVSTIHHIGSTAIPGIHAKPIIDILIEVTSIDGVKNKYSAMQDLGYECMGEYGIPGRRYFRKITPEGIRTHHVHMFKVNSEHISRHLAFRDYLISNPAKAQEYSNLKRKLVVDHNGDWDLYVNGKEPFIKNTEQIALAWIKNLID